MKNAPSRPAGTPRIRHRPLALFAVAALVLSACGEATVPAPDPLGADPGTIASMRLSFDPDPTKAGSVTIARSGTITGDPVVFVGGPYPSEGDDAIPLEATFLDVGGTVVRPLVGVELVVTPADPMALKYQRRDDFTGMLTLLRTGDTQIRLELVRGVDRKSILGPFALPVTVRP